MANHKFKVGDRLVASSDIWFPKGTLVTVVVVCDGNNMPYLCDDGKFKLWVSEDDLAPSSEADKRFEFHVGQIYRVTGDREESGNIIKIVWANDLSAEYKVIRGTGVYEKQFCVRSAFADSLELLTGSQIGEAIHKWDADHAEKKPGVKEVKRHAKPGEYIKIVCPEVNGQCYGLDDVLKVFERRLRGVYAFTQKNHPCHSKNTDRPTSWIADDEYVVLEGYNPEKEEHRKAKIGDTIKIICDCGGFVKPGTVWQVSSATEGGQLSIKNKQYGGGFACSYGNYVVLNSGKHVYTDVEIGEARRFVLHTICTLAEKDVHVIFSHASGDENDDSAFSCYILDHGASMNADDNGFTADAKRYNSVCSENDEPNEWVGKAVALCKALHKPLPDYAR